MDFDAYAALTVCAAAIPDHVRIRVKVHKAWIESARLWTTLIGPPSAKKSPILRAALAPLKRVEKHMVARNFKRLPVTIIERDDERPQSVAVRLCVLQ